MNRRDYIKNTTFLVGYTVSVTLIADLLASCQSSSSLNWNPVFFNKHQAETISEIADTICPTTQSPGAKDIAIPQFIDRLVQQLFSKEDQAMFIHGIEELDKICNKKYSKDFKDCNKKNKEEMLIELDKMSAPLPLTMWGKPLEAHPKQLTFYRRIKTLVLTGYFTSEKIGKEYLAYDPVPGKFIACMPLHNQNSWTE
ncbi:MAG: gluconate 2-dehydrogenase subunit 3 family protein [Bacteroidota bacterium]|nr:gluconate 2-dehydrogenase subunit 3 family protein [Bacteroidota bacterium]